MRCNRGHLGLLRPEDGGSNSSVQFAGAFSLVVSSVFASLLDVLVDLSAIDLDVMAGLAHLLEFLNILSTDLREILEDNSDLSDELIELVDTVGDFGVRAILEIGDSRLHVGDQ